MPKTPARIVARITAIPYWWAYAVGLILLIASSWLWWTKVYLHPATVFWGMLESSLSTDAATIVTKQSSEQSSVNQYVQFDLRTVNRARSLATVKQGDTTIKTELIGTPDVTYSRYIDIDTNQKNAAGKALDVSKVEGVWAERKAAADASESGQQLFAQALIGVGLPLGSVPVPVGAVSPEQRAALLRFIRDQGVYEASLMPKDVVTARTNGRLEYTYTVKIQTLLYVRLMKNFAKDLGLANLDDVEPNDYSGAEPLSVQLTVDAVSRHLSAVSVAGGGYSQRYTSYGAPLKVTLPTKAISNDALQKRLSEL